MHQKKARGTKPWIIIGCVTAALLWLPYALDDIPTPLVTVAVLVYVLNPLVEWLQLKHFKRGTVSMMVMVFALPVLLALTPIIVPMLINQLNNLVARSSQVTTFVQNALLPWLSRYADKYIELDIQSIVGWLQLHTGELSGTLQKITPEVMKQSSNIISGVSNLFLLSFLPYYFLFDWGRWSQGISKLVPRRSIDTYLRITGNMDEVLGEFLYGQLMVTLIMGVIYGVGLTLTGLDSGFAIGMIVGILAFVPYLGALAGFLLATVAALLQFGTWHGPIMVWVVSGVGQFPESFIATPKIVGDHIGLSPFWVIFSLMAFGQLVGFVGMLAGPPPAAMTLVLLREGVATYFDSRFYKHEQIEAV